MLFDQISLLAAVGFSGSALCLTLLIAWLGSRTDMFLLSWSAGMALIVVGVILFTALGTNYESVLQLASFTFLILGFGFVHAGAMQLRLGAANWKHVAIASSVGILAMAAAFSSGYSGAGTILANFAIAILLGLTAFQYWLGRAEARVPLMANVLLYLASSISFLMCALALLQDGQFVLTERPSNWAEHINAIVCIVGITGIGAVSLTLNQSRLARRHRNDALTDPLTGTLNRRALFEIYEKSTVAPGTAFLALDLDHFKSINDHYGHDTGDLVIRRFADVLRHSVRQTDIVARLGGEEFCVVLPGITERKAIEVAERIRIKMEGQVVETQSGLVRATVSAGLAMCLEPEPFEVLMKRADSALYDAKRNGRNQVKSDGLKLAA